jgi:drug/metabolite transporter (DMT)-like permease
MPINIAQTEELKTMSYLMLGCVAVYLGVLLAPTLPTWGKYGRATLDRPQGWILFGAYAIVAVAYLLWTFVLKGDASDAAAGSEGKD